MKELRKINISFNKGGSGSLNSRISLPIKWTRELGFSEDDKKAVVEIDNNKIVIRKEVSDMILIKEKNVTYDYTLYDYKLENGMLLNVDDWNGDVYTRAFDPQVGLWNNNSFKPVYRYEIDNIDISNIEENSQEWNYALEILGFKEY